MNIKHNLFINGLHITVWGPASRAKCYVLLLKKIAYEQNCSYADLIYSLQLTDIEPLTHPLRAYRAWGIVYQYLSQCDNTFFLRSDDFLSSSPQSLRPKVPSANKVNTTSEPLKESMPPQTSQSGGIIFGLLTRIRRNHGLRHTLLPQILTFLLVTGTIFGFLAAPIR